MFKATFRSFAIPQRGNRRYSLRANRGGRTATAFLRRLAGARHAAWPLRDAVVHMFLFLPRARNGNEALAAIAQETVDTFFTDIDHSLRELGIGDVSVPKRMKKLARDVLRARAVLYAGYRGWRPVGAGRGAGPQRRPRASPMGGRNRARPLWSSPLIMRCRFSPTTPLPAAAWVFAVPAETESQP